MAGRESESQDLAASLQDNEANPAEEEQLVDSRTPAREVGRRSRCI